MTAVRRPNRRRIPELAQIADGGVCRQTGKLRYFDERTATIAMRQIAKRDPSRARLNVFDCDHCGDWHVGHTPKGPNDAD